MQAVGSITTKRVVVVLPYGMTIRAVMETDAIQYLMAQQDTDITFATPLGEHEERFKDCPHLHWVSLTNPAVPSSPAPHLLRRVGHFLHRNLNRLLRHKAGFENLHFRFHFIHQFQAHLDRMKMSSERQELEYKAGNYIEPQLGFPFPKSWLVFRLLYCLYYATWQANSPSVEAFFDQYQPDLLVLVHVQNEVIKPYNIAARRRRIPVLGVVASWDQPTTKGPVCPDIHHFVVQSNRMKQELIQYHGVEPERIEVIGWTQMDIYHDSQRVIEPRDTFFKEELSLDPERNLLVYGTYPARLGRFEPSIVRHLATQIQAGKFGRCTLIVRPHPRDDQWQVRLMEFHNPPYVVIQPPEWGRLDYLTNLMFHTDILLTCASTIALDAVAVDTPVINIAFDGDVQLPYYESAARYFKWDHYKAIAESGGTQVVENFEALDHAILRYLENPQADAAGRERLRQDQLAPFDGKASQRFAEIIRRPLRDSRKPFNYRWLKRPGGQR